jgi:hypothetical protein
MLQKQNFNRNERSPPKSNLSKISYMEIYRVSYIPLSWTRDFYPFLKIEIGYTNDDTYKVIIYLSGSEIQRKYLCTIAP